MNHISIVEIIEMRVTLIPFAVYVITVVIAHSRANRVQPFRLEKGAAIPVRGHPLLRRVCTSVLPYGQALRGVLIVLPYRQFLTCEIRVSLLCRQIYAFFFKQKYIYHYCLPDTNNFRTQRHRGAEFLYDHGSHRL